MEKHVNSTDNIKRDNVTESREKDLGVYLI